MFSNFFSENREVYETVWKNMVQSDRPQVTASSVVIACGIHRATNTHAEYLILLLHGNNVCTNASKCNVICALPILLNHEKYLCVCVCVCMCVDHFDNKNIYLVPAVVW